MPTERTAGQSVSRNHLDANAIAKLATDVMHADDYSSLPGIMLAFEKTTPYQIVHIGVYKLDNAPVKNVIYSRAFRGLPVTVSDFSDELKWGVCIEAEKLMRPFNLLTHEFLTFETSRFQSLRALASQSGITQIMIIPFQFENTLGVVIANFPDHDYEEQLHTALPHMHQLLSSIFTRFPTLLKWSDKSILTRRETEILQLTSQGLTESGIAEQLGISANTVRNHIENCKTKLGAKNKLHAVTLASRFKEIDPITIN